MRATLVILAALCVAFAGCSEKTSTQGPDGPNPPVEVDKDTGALRGVVVDEALRPLVGVQIVARHVENADAPSLEAATDGDGLFVFNRIVPGAYVVKAEKLGFVATQSTASVVAGADDPPVMRLQLLIDPESTPSAQTIKLSGFIECSVRFYDASGATTPIFGEPYYNGINACNGLGNQQTNFPVSFEGMPDHVQGELVWRSSQATGSGLTLVAGPQSCLDIKWGRADGTSPLVVPVNRTVLEENEDDDSAEGMCFRVFSWVAPDTGDFFGAALSQEFELFVTVFYNFTPEEGWSFTGDGEPQPPA